MVPKPALLAFPRIVGRIKVGHPTVQARGATYAIGTPGHSWQLTAQGKTAAAHKGLVHVAKVMACTAVDVLQDDVLLARAKAIIRRACDARPMSARCRTNWIRPSRCPCRSRRAVYRQAGRVKAARPIFSAACSTSNASSAPNISWPITSARSNTRRPCRRRSATSRPRRGARVIRHERLLLAVPADHHLADEVQALEVEALSGETLILSQYEEDAGFADYVTDSVAACRPMPEARAGSRLPFAR